ncbi:MAG: signal peptidase II [Hamadaea sp.]|uniref:signal peptidase II n=1 Tax=Hamadaea sp. NPDC050747 TaxID=3155789 RepID=UPI0017B32676|nr:signal peptidase II [Hamadaea sp.]
MSELGSVAVSDDEGETRPLPDAVPATAISVRRAVLTLIAVAVVIIGLDAATKEWATNTLEGADPVRLLGGLVYFSFTRNSGAAWSMGSNYTYVFPFIAFAVAAWIGWTARKLRSLPWAIALGLVLGGALGNLVDRVFRYPGGISGHVVDFISLFGPYGQRFPIFNIADMALSFGVCLAILLEFTGRQRDGSRLRRETKEEQREETR